MADFDLAYKGLILAEGGYADNPLDEGKETYKGISRRWHPEWEGWQIIDAIKNYIGYDGSDEAKKRLNEALEEDWQLQNLVEEFYKKHYWDKFNGDSLPQTIATKLLEMSVLLGTGKKGALWLQQAINYENERLHKPKIAEDAIIGKGTLKALSELDEDMILKWLELIQNRELINEIMQKPQKIVFYDAWQNRIAKTRKYLDSIRYA